ncbi:MAG: CvpA family protein [Clostridia bacterium]|nr:CvpA family protein [Clostridia bacterium]
MNIVDIVILAVVAISVIYGFYHGFVHTVLSVGCCLISVVLAMHFAPQLSAILRSNEGVTQTLANYTDAVARVGDYELASTQVQGMETGLIQQVLSSVELPSSIAVILENNLRNASFSGTFMTTVNDYVSNTVVAVAINVLCFVLCFAVIYLLLSMVVSLIKHVFKFPLLKMLDWLAGGAFGLVRGAVLVYMLFLLVPILSTVLPVDGFDALLQESRLASLFMSDGFFAGVIAGRF